MARVRRNHEHIGRTLQEIERLEHAISVLKEHPEFNRFYEMVEKL